MDPEKVTRTGTQQTALVTLYGKALDNRRPDSVLDDRLADEAVQHIDFAFTSLRMRRRDQKSSAVRSKAYDRLVTRFLDGHPACVVLHLGCGLDTRAYRVQPPPTVDWYDIDLPDVIVLRRRLFPSAQVCTLSTPQSPTRICSTRSPATDRSWLSPRG